MTLSANGNTSNGPANSAANRAAAVAKQQAQAQREQNQQKPTLPSGIPEGGKIVGGHVYDAQGNPVSPSTIANTKANRDVLDKAGISYTANGSFIYANKADLAAAINSRDSSILGSASQAEGAVNPKGYTTDAKVTQQVRDVFSNGPPTREDWGSEILKAKIAGDIETAQTQKAKNQQAEQGKSYGGLETPQSVGKDFGWLAVGTQRESIGTKIFADEKSFTRNSPLENEAKTSENTKATKAYPNYENPEYYNPIKPSDKTGGPETKASAGRSFGWGKLGTQFTRGSPLEVSTEKSEAIRAQNKELGTAITGGKVSHQILLTENVGMGEKVGVKSTSPISSSSNAMSESDFAAMLSGESQKGAVFEILSPSGQILGKTSGQRAYHDYLAAQEKYGQDITITPTFPTIENELVSSIKANPQAYANKPASYWENLGAKGYLTSEGASKINQIFSDYYISQQPSTVKSTLDKNSVLATDLQKSASESYTGHYLNTNPVAVSTFGVPYKIPTFLAQELTQINKGLSLPVLSWDTLKETGQNMAAFFGQGLKSFPVMFSAGVTTLSDVAMGKDQTGSVAHNPSAVLEGVAYPGDILSPHAKSVSENVATQMHGFAKSTGTSGIIPNYVQNPKTAGAAFGTLTAIAITGYGLRGLSPLKLTKWTAQTELESGEIKPLYQGVEFGYNAIGTPVKLIGKVSGKWKIGEPTYGEYVPEGSKPSIPNPGRGLEIATPTKSETKVVGSEGFWQRLEEVNPSARAEKVPGIEVITLQDVKTLNKFLAGNPETNIQYSNKLSTYAPEGLTPEVVRGALVGGAKRQGAINFFNPLTGRTGLLQGSRSTSLYLPSDVLEMMRRIAPEQDIDYLKTNFGGIMEEFQAKNLAKSTYSEVQKEQGVLPEEGVSFHATTSESARNIVRKGINFNAAESNAGFFSMNTAEGLNFGNKMLRIEYNPSKILKFKDLSKQVRDTFASKNWHTFQSKLIGYSEKENAKAYAEYLASSKKPVPSGIEEKYGGVEKPYYNTRRGAGANPEATRNEIIFTSKSPIKKITWLKNYVPTELKGRKIYAGGNKLVEFVTSKDETGSSASKSGQVYGIDINEKVGRATIEGTGQRVKTTSGIRQAQTNIAKIGLQSKESAEAQAGTPEQLAKIGKGSYVAPELFAGKAYVRPYYQTIATFKATFKNPSKRAAAFKALEAAHRIRHYQFENPETRLFDWEESVKQAQTEKETSTLVRPSSSLAASSKYGVKSALASPIISKSSSRSSQSSRSRNSQNISSRLSSKSSRLSSISKMVSLSSKSAISRSSVSSFSSISGTSGVSGRSGSSRVSKSGPSGFSRGSLIPFTPYSGTPSGSSRKPPPSRPYGSSGPSRLPPPRLSGVEYPPPPTPPNTPPILKLEPTWNIKRRYFASPKYTKTKRLSVLNPFSSRLNIIGE